MKNAIYIIGLLLILCHTSNAQNATSRTFEDKINKSDAVVEGVVINGNVYGRWTDNFHATDGTYNSFIIKVSKVFKGEVKDTIIELVISALPSPDNSLGKDVEGIYFLKANNSSIQSGKNIQSFFYLYPSSMIVYDIYKSLHETRIEGKTTSDFEKDIYTRIESITGTPRKVIGLMPFEIEMQKHPPNLDGDTTITFPNGNRMRVFKKDLKN